LWNANKSKAVLKGGREMKGYFSKGTFKKARATYQARRWVINY